MKHTICLMNDSFPPQIDGVSNTVANYARIIEQEHGHSVVVTPDIDEKNDEQFPFPVLRYASLDARWFIGYMAGIPFSPTLTKRMKDEKVELMHCHCPAAALFLARELRGLLKVPVVMTYHTKYDVDILKAFKSKQLSGNVIKIMISNINSCDEVWTVSRGAGDNLKSLGFKGDYIVMPNGVDLPRGRVSDSAIQKVTGGYDLPPEIPVFLFVGRIFWYKGLRLIIDALEGLKSQNVDFRMVFVGSGADFDAVRAYVTSLGLDDKVIFTGAVKDRDQIRAWYCRADLFLFPSTYDTNGLVVREAASCSLPSVLVAGSCAAEGVSGDRNGFFISETASSLAVKLYQLCSNREMMKRVGERAAEELYISWENAVAKACERYEIVIDNYKSGRYPKRRRISDRIMKGNGEFMNVLSHLPTFGDD